MKRWGLCWKSRREWTLLVCHARMGRFPVITVYALREMNRPQPDGSRHQGAAQFHTVFSHTWSGIIQNKLDWALWCQLGNRILDVLLKTIMADVVLFEHHTHQFCKQEEFAAQIHLDQHISRSDVNGYRTIKWFVWKNTERAESVSRVQ